MCLVIEVGEQDPEGAARLALDFAAGCQCRILLSARQRLQDAYQRIKNGEDFGQLAKLLSDDPGSANDGGELGWAGPGAFVPEFERTINDLDIGEMSEPFRSPFGWHIVEVLDRRVYDNTEDLKEQNCVVRIRAGKRDDETQLWVRRLRDEAYVDVRM